MIYSDNDYDESAPVQLDALKPCYVTINAEKIAVSQSVATPFLRGPEWSSRPRLPLHYRGQEPDTRRQLTSRECIRGLGHIEQPLRSPKLYLQDEGTCSQHSKLNFVLRPTAEQVCYARLTMRNLHKTCRENPTLNGVHQLGKMPFIEGFVADSQYKKIAESIIQAPNLRLSLGVYLTLPEISFSLERQADRCVLVMHEDPFEQLNHRPGVPQRLPMWINLTGVTRTSVSEGHYV